MVATDRCGYATVLPKDTICAQLTRRIILKMSLGFSMYEGRVKFVNRSLVRP
jgi:hypothetical protein